MGKYKLTYFNAMGRAEIIRLVFAQAGVEFEDIRIEKSDWPALKERLDGADDWEAAKIQELFGVTSDLVNHAIPFWIATDENEKKKLMDEFEKEHLAPLFVRLDKILQQNGRGFFVGEKLTVADLNMLCIIGLFSSMFPNTAAKHPHLTEFKEKIMSLPNIKKWIETRPKTDFR
uniref:glutathione transferase n=1 Tax=Ascaris lumbricoides TaxID=6252 RepID=A0A0M3HR45_ASCLU